MNIFQIFRSGRVAPLCVVAVIGVVLASARGADLATWSAGTDPAEYGNPDNWSTDVVPINSVARQFIVEIPGGAIVNYDLVGSATVDAFRLRDNGQFIITGEREYRIDGVSILGGLISATGAGAVFLSEADTAGFSDLGYLLAREGGVIRIGARSFEMRADYRGHRSLFEADGADAVIDLDRLNSMTVHGGHGGGWRYRVAAINGGVVDLSGMTTVTGARSDEFGNNDWLDFVVENGGTLDLSNLQRVVRRTLFSLGQSFELPALETADHVRFDLAEGVTLDVPELTRIDREGVVVRPGSTLNAGKLRGLLSTAVELSPGGRLNAPLLDDLSGTRLELVPDADLVTDSIRMVDRLSLTVVDRSGPPISATSYDLPSDWRGHRTLFEADGATAELDLSSLGTITTQGGHGGGWNYLVAARNGARVDLSGVTVATGPRWDEFGDNDWLTFQVEPNSTIDLSALSRVTRRTRFISENSMTLPALESVDRTLFDVRAGVTVELPLLETAEASEFRVDFAGEIHAPALETLEGGILNIEPGGTLSAPMMVSLNRVDLFLEPGRNVFLGSIASVDGISLRIKGDAPITVSATAFELAQDWRGHRTLFEADGDNAVLELGSLESMRVHGGWSGGWDYTVVAKNRGTVDLSGLVSVSGARSDTFDNDDWLSFYVNPSSRIDLASLEEVHRRTRFMLEESMEMPELNRMDGGWVTVAPGVELTAPKLAAVTRSVLEIEPGGLINAPALSDLTRSSIFLANGADLVTAPVEVIDGLSLRVVNRPGLNIAATSYALPEDWRGNRTLLEADGPEGVIDAASVEVLSVPGGWSGAWNYPVRAFNGGTIDLTGLRTITGARSDVYNADDWLTIQSDAAGVVRLGDVALRQRARIRVLGTDFGVVAENIHLAAPASIGLEDDGSLDLTGSFSFDNGSDTQIGMTDGGVRFRGGNGHFLEVGGADGGPGGSSAGNFGIGRLEVGTSVEPATVLVVDRFDNGNRGESGEPEALYLYGLDDVSLLLHPGSKLVIGDIPVYALVGGAMERLNDLLGPGTGAAEFGDGLIAVKGGPAVAGMTPSGRVLPVVDHVDIEFDIAIDPTSFGTADVQLNGPSGPVPVSGVNSLGDRMWRIEFAGQTENGMYSVVIGPGVADSTGLLTAMDQNQNGVSGEPGDVFAGEFIVDVRGPEVLSAVVLRGGTRVGVRFDEPVEPVSAEDPANYDVGGVQPTEVVLRPDNASVELTVPAQSGESFTLRTVNIGDPLGNIRTTPADTTGRVLPLRGVEIGNPGAPQASFTADGRRFDLTAGGTVIWNNSDRFRFVYEPRPGDFDVIGQVSDLVPISQWSRVGLMARESLDANSRHVAVMVYSPEQANVREFHHRPETGSASALWGESVSGVDLDRTWIRLRRQGNTFTGYLSSDGSEWTLHAEMDIDFPETMQVGFALSSENFSSPTPATAVLENVGDYTPSILTHPVSQTVLAGLTAVFRAEARGAGEVRYQWYFEGDPVPDGTGPVLRIENADAGDDGDYHVVASSDLGSIRSRDATLTVDTSNPGSGFEADLAPRPDGSGAVSVADWTLVGRLAAGLDESANASEFTRADCAPRTTLGNGIIGLADWTQAGRYAAGLDPLTSAGGPNGLSTMNRVTSDSGGLAKRQGEASGQSVTLRTIAFSGRQIVVGVDLDAVGDENAFGVSVGFDPDRMAFTGAEAGMDGAGAVLLANDRDSTSGRVGVAIALPAGQALSPGRRELVRLAFEMKQPGVATVSMTDRPVAGEIADVTAASRTPVLADAPQLLTAPEGGVWWPVSHDAAGADRAVILQAPPGARFRIEVSDDLNRWTELVSEAVSSGSGVLRVADPDGTGRTRRFYRAIRVGE